MKQEAALGVQKGKLSRTASDPAPFWLVTSFYTYPEPTPCCSPLDLKYAGLKYDDQNGNADCYAQDNGLGSQLPLRHFAHRTATFQSQDFLAQNGKSQAITD
jgi:hypothetical protein